MFSKRSSLLWLGFAQWHGIISLSLDSVFLPIPLMKNLIQLPIPSSNSLCNWISFPIVKTCNETLIHSWQMQLWKLPALLKDCCCENWLADFVNRFHYSLTLIPYIPSFPPSCKFLLSFPLVIKTHIFLIKYWFANDERWDGMFDIVWLFPSRFPVFCIYFPFPYINSFP